jgi:tetratricopeptide (TPR) repeat protein
VNRPFDPARFVALDALLQQALDRDESDRMAFLERLGSEQPDTAADLRAMLEQADADVDALASLLDARLWASLADDPAAGQRFGAWRARGTLAHGGMARVLYAERADGGFEQCAAIKCLWSGLATAPLIARFEQERQILAHLDDPRIARLLDGGVRADGVPWLALEYVAGRSIDDYCDSTRLDLDGRLSLWDEAAAAVATAHRQLVVHRDLKPANVMVSSTGAVKLLDFGIAKLVEPEGFPHAAPPTRLDGRALTFEYASPEQLRAEPVTTSSDIYQLGLLLHELACGTRPFRGVGAGGRRDVDEEPVAPSVAAVRNPYADARAEQRSTTSRRLARRLRGDFDAIVMHALARSPSERYDSVDALREDVRRWRLGLPVRARRAGTLRRCAKWLRRNRWLATGAAAFVGIAMAYTITALMQAHAIEREAATNRAVRDYLVGWFQAAAPGDGAGRDPSASEMLASGLLKARHDLDAQPDVKAEVLSIIGGVYIARGDYTRAEPVLREANALYRSLQGVDPLRRGASFAALAELLHYTNRYDEAEALFREAIGQQTAAGGDAAFRTLMTRQLLADLLHSRGRYAEAIAELDRAIMAASDTRGETAPLIANLERSLADVYRDSGRQVEAEAAYRRALATQQQAHGELHPNTAATRLGLGRLLLEQGRYDEAATQIETGFASVRRTQRDGTPASLYWERVIAELEEARGDLDAAAARLRRLEDASRAQLPAGHLILAYLALDAGYVALGQGHVREAQREFGTAGRIFDAIQPQGHPRRIEVRLGEALLARQRNDDSATQPLLAAAVAQARAQLAPTHPLFAALADAAATADAEPPGIGLAALRVQRALAIPVATR